MPPITLPQALALAQQHHQAGRLAEAESIYQQILAVAPQHAEALNFLGVIASQTGRHELAVALMRQSIALAPHSAVFLDNLGTALREIGQLEEAIACSRRALALDPNEPASHHNLANALQDQGHFSEAIASYRRALALAPLYTAAHLGLGQALLDLGLVREAEAAYRRVLELEPGSAEIHSSLVALLQYRDDIEPAASAAEHRRWDEIHAQPLRPTLPPPTNDPAPERRLRIGYVSPDFRQHPVAFFLEGLLAQHDRAVVEVFCYANVRRSDQGTARLRQHADHWRDIFPLTDAQAATLIRADRIDLLVDLAGHTADHRLLVFARRPAPVQVTYLGYSATTGLGTMDYRLTDAHADPVESGEPASAERLVRLPDCFSCYRPPDDAPAVGPLPALSRGHVTFASFHTLAKLNARLLDCWAQILTRVPASRLLLVAVGLRDIAAQERLRSFFAERGIPADRLEFHGWLRLAEYLALHRRVDILLDSHPFSGHTASCHALWMGVPVITHVGPRPCSRMVASVLRTVGLSEFIAATPDEYIRLAGELAHDPARLAALRGSLRERLTGSPLTDAARFARAVETAYRQMWRARREFRD
jgi:predicted O-linked N-acetylglucosamine transferase (SPINDLY family)